jgi:NADPH:quinone reductase-like Zn-dependent oxidoreductase
LTFLLAVERVMKAAVLTRYGDVDALELREVEDPHPKSAEVKVHVAASSLNALDLKILSGAVKEWFPQKFPSILGFDASGEVVELGAGVSGLSIGDRVFGQMRHSLAEYATAPASALARIPLGLALVDAAAIPVVGLTGAQLIETIQPGRGDRVLVTGALGSVGRVAVHVARKAGASVVAGVRGERAKEARALGADEVLALDDPAAVEHVALLSGIADTVGGETTRRLLPRLRPGGVLASAVGAPSSGAEHVTVKAISSHADGRLLVELGQEISRGELVLPVAGRFPLAQVREAFRRAGEGAGKVLVTR